MNITQEQSNTLRQYLTRIYDACEEAARAGSTVSINGYDLNLRQLFEIETTAYLMFLSAADGEISQPEINFINDIMSRTYSMDDCIKFVESSNMTAEEFLKEPPASFKMLAEYAETVNKDVMDALISFYDVLGTVMVQSDNKLEESEYEAYKGFIYSLRGYKSLNEPEE